MSKAFIDTTLIDGFADGPHITEEQVGLANQGLYGPGDYVLDEGKKSEAQILTNNSIRIFDATYVIQGRRDVIAANDYTDVNIDNGSQGMNRNDIIVRRYEKDESSEIEKTSYAVIKGTPTSGTASDPEVTTGVIRNGATLHEMKLYRVKLNGLNIVAVEPLFDVLMHMSTLNKSLSDLSFEVIKTQTGYLKKYNNGLFEAWAKATIPNTEFGFTQIGTTGLYFARYTNLSFGIKATEILNIQTSAYNPGIIWAIRPSISGNQQAIDGFVIQQGSDNTKTTVIDAYIVGKWL